MMRLASLYIFYIFCYKQNVNTSLGGTWKFLIKIDEIRDKKVIIPTIKSVFGGKYSKK